MNFQVELTSVCDLTCGYCPNKDMERSRTFMSDEVFDRILSDYIIPYKDYNRYCNPTFIGHKDGEPLLNKQLPKRLQAIPADMHIDIYSHGLMLPKWRNRGQDFMDFLGTLPNRVRYMMSYHPFNHDNSANDYAPVIAYLKDVFLAPPYNVEFITVSHKSRWVSQEMQDAWRDTWAGYPITVHCNCSINPWTGRIEDATTVFNGCPYADFGHWFFGVTGNVIACCLDLEEEIVLGNVLVDDPTAMFEKTKVFYESQKQTYTHQVCANCFGDKRTDLLQLGVK